MVEDHRAGGTGQLLDEFDGLGIVFLLDGLITVKGLVLSGSTIVLEASCVQGDGVFPSADVLNLDLARDILPVTLTSTSCGVSIDVDVGCRAVFRGGEVV